MSGKLNKNISMAESGNVNTDTKTSEAYKEVLSITSKHSIFLIRKIIALIHYCFYLITEIC